MKPHSNFDFNTIIMRSLALPAALLLVAVAHMSLASTVFRGPGGPGGEPPAFDCTDKVGYFADLWRNCEVYYECLEDGHKVTHGCPNFPEQLYFDESIQQCVSGNSFTCPPPPVLYKIYG